MKLALALACLLVVGALPLGLADLSENGGSPLGAPLAPQQWCAIVQTQPHARGFGAQRCDDDARAVQGVSLLRVRIVGEAHAFAYADVLLSGSTYQQLGNPAECAASASTLAYASCSTLFTNAPHGLAGTVSLHLAVDGPGHAVVTATVEQVLISLP